MGWTTACGVLVSCTAAGVPPTPTAVDTAIGPTQTAVVDTRLQRTVATAPPTQAPPARTATVRRGAIEEIVTLTGQVIGRSNLEIAAPETTRTRRTFVGPGRTVSEGQPLVEIEGGERQRQVDELRGREQEAARRAEAAQTRIQERRDQVNEELSGLPQPGALAAEVQLAQSAALQARVGLQRAEADLAELTAPPNPADVRAADQQIRTAELALQRAEADRERVLDGPSDAELRQAEADVAVAEAEVRRAIDVLRKLEGGPDPAKVQTARRAVELAQSALQLAQRPPPDIVHALALVRVARDRGTPERRAAQAVARQQVAVALVRQQIKVERAEAELAEAVRTLQDVSRGPGTVEVEAASRDFDAALRKLASARERLMALQSGPPQIEVDAANVAVEGARAMLDQSLERRAALDAGSPAGQLAAARAAVSSARVALASADERVAEVTNQQRQVIGAQARLGLLNGILSGAVYAPDEAAKPGVDPDIVEFAEAQRELAEARREVAAVAGDPNPTTLVAPAAGMVTAVLTGPGEETGPGRPAVTMIRTGDLVVQASLETQDGSRLAPGMPARVRLAAAPGTDLAATVDRIDATPGDRTVQFSVTWASPLPALGSEAQARVQLQRREDTLLVPRSANRTDGGRTFVDVLQGNTTQRVEISTGIADEMDVEVLGGLQEGQLVVVGP